MEVIFGTTVVMGQSVDGSIHFLVCICVSVRVCWVRVCMCHCSWNLVSAHATRY